MSSQVYWTRNLELALVDFVKERHYMWKNLGNTNYHIEKKYKGYAEFAAKLGKGYTARSVRDRWVNIRSTFHHNLRRVEKSESTEMMRYEPCWPLWKPLQFLREKQHSSNDNSTTSEKSELPIPDIKPALHDIDLSAIRQTSKRTNRPKRLVPIPTNRKKTAKCKTFINDLVTAMSPLAQGQQVEANEPYWFFGRHVTEQLNQMKAICADRACQEILKLLIEPVT